MFSSLSLYPGGKPMSADLSIGQKLAKWRKDKGMTLQQLADKADLTAAFISQIEHDKASPSIATLKSIAHALEARVIDFFADELLEDPVVTTPDMWTRVLIPGWQSDTKRMVRSVASKRMEPFLTTIKPGGKSRDPYSHPGEEFGFVLQGEITITVGNDTYTVGAMSSFYYSSLLPHSWINKGRKTCKIIWVVSPPSW
jgi:transcriptional regulator with XRE-family HTH domain